MTSGKRRNVSAATQVSRQFDSSSFVRLSSNKHHGAKIKKNKSINEFSIAMGVSIERTIYLFFAIVLCCFVGCGAIRCYQCSSDTDPHGQDICGSYNKFDKYKNIPIDCSSQDSYTPGTFCVKVTRQSPRGFIWDGRWRQVIRRCASVTSTGVTGVCNWGVDENGVYWEECSCSEDGCNGASSIYSTSTIFLVTIALSYAILSCF